MIDYDKSKIREELTIENIFELLQDWGGDPEYTNFGILSSTICHNEPGEGSRKLYYYTNTGLFKCYTGCDAIFDIFELTIKVFKIQKHQELDLNDAIRYIAFHFGIIGDITESPEDEFKDWVFFNNYDRIQSIEIKDTTDIQIKKYDDAILTRLNYSLSITPWLKEGISQDVIQHNRIGFFPGGDQITIPHYDKDGNFIGLRGRSICAEDADRFGKYRPVRISGKIYSHPLGLNLYNLNNSKNNIAKTRTAIVFESEKSTLLYQTYFGSENDISVACCGSSFSSQQMLLLKHLGVQEIIVAYDRQFQEIGDKEFKHLKANLLKLYNKYKNYVLISFIFDKNMITGYKDAPIDCGKDIFLQLFKERIVL